MDHIVDQLTRSFAERDRLVLTMTWSTEESVVCIIHTVLPHRDLYTRSG